MNYLDINPTSWYEKVQVLYNYKEECMELSERLERIKNGVEKTEGAPNIVVAQIDPDALGSAVGAHQLLIFFLKMLGREGDVPQIWYCGKPARSMNRTIFNVLNLQKRMKPISEFQGDRMPNVVLVDSSLIEDGRIPIPITPILAIDHHRGDSPESAPEGPFVDIIDEKVGAASTLLVELLREAGCTPTEEDAMLLALGIYTDTKDIPTAPDRDFEAYRFLRQFIDREKMRKIIKGPIPKSNLLNFRDALNRLNQEGTRIVTNIGAVSFQGSDDAAEIADYLITLEGVQLVVVWALIKEENKVRFSTRSTDSSLPIDTFLKERFGIKTGGKITPFWEGEGGGFIDLDEFGTRIAEDSSTARKIYVIDAWMRALTFFDD